MAQCAVEQTDRQVLLIALNFLEGQARTFHGNEVPIQSFAVREFELRFGSLLAVQRGQEIRRCLRHRIARAMCCSFAGKGQQRDAQ